MNTPAGFLPAPAPERAVLPPARLAVWCRQAGRIFCQAPLHMHLPCLLPIMLEGMLRLLPTAGVVLHGVSVGAALRENLR